MDPEILVTDTFPPHRACDTASLHPILNNANRIEKILNIMREKFFTFTRSDTVSEQTKPAVCILRVLTAVY